MAHDTAPSSGGPSEAAGPVEALVAAVAQGLVIRDRELAGEVLTGELTWLRWLPVGERAACVDELLDDLAGGDLVRFHQDLVAWCHTAWVHSDPELAGRLAAPVGGGMGPVARPGSGR